MSSNKCINCKKETQNPKFCSRSCSASFNNKKNPKRTLEGTCAGCGEIISSSRKWCYRCSPWKRDYSKITISDIHGKAKYQISARIRGLARQAYKRYGLPQKCEYCGYDKHFEVCHVKAISSFDPNTPISEINQKTNLVGLCRNHHWEQEHEHLLVAQRIERLAPT